MKLNRLKSSFIVINFAVLVFTISGFSDQICEMYFTTCPENFDGDTLFVPPDIVALSANVFACDPSEIIEGIMQSGGPPSIVFIIDHSYSMMGWGNSYPGNDAFGSRFNVTSDLVDTIYKLHPDAEVGVVVFREMLYFDHRNNSNFVPLVGQGDQSYLPLLQLNSKYVGNLTGLQTVRSVLQTDTVTRYNSRHQVNVEAVDLTYKPDFNTIGNTNINNAFAAALQAMQTAQYPKERQFIIFLSDGEPYPLGDPSQHGGKDPFYFQQGANTPTTFTVYLHNEATEPPQSMQTMTENISTNGYSTSNKVSDIWVLETDYEALMSLFMENILKPILIVTSGTPTSMSVNSFISTNLGDSGFVFSERFPLQAQTTTFNINIDYHLTNLNTGVERDTTTYSTIYVVRKDGAVLSPDVAKLCWDRGDLFLYYNNLPVSYVDETMPKLDIRFIPGTTEYQSVVVEVTATQGQSRDLENINLLFNSEYWSKGFVRSLDDVLRGDSALQHQLVDSIIVTYRNPKIPLDTLRVAVPFSVSKTLTFPAATYNDSDADGFVDSIFIGVSGNFTEEDVAALAALITLPPERNFKIDSIVYASGGLVYYVTENSAIPQTYITKTDIIQVKQGILPAGGMVVGGTITVQDKIAPVIVSALLVLSGTSDSVRVTFSEPIRDFSSSRPFLFRTPNGAQYEVYLDPDGVFTDGQFTYTGRIKQVEGDKYINSSDSIWINTSASITDTAGNIQLDPNNRRVEISVKQVPYTVVPRAYNNPLNPGVPVPTIVKEAYVEAGKPLPSKTGIVLMVEPDSGNLRPGVKLSGKASIFDVVKNPIIENVPMVEKDGSLYFIWNGHNDKGRKVSTGTYIAIMKITDNQNPPNKANKSIRIGVKR